MDTAPVHCILINFILKGGPPWGFRIKERMDRVVVSKVSHFDVLHGDVQEMAVRQEVNEKTSCKKTALV